jgi:hypothetical protein
MEQGAAMPYYIYKINPMRILEKLDQYEKFPEASRVAKELRARIGPEDNYGVKVIFAKNELEAEDMLSQQREFIQTGEDY